MPLSERILPHYTYEDYVQWEGRWELIEGFPIALSPSPTPRHQWICGNTAAVLSGAIKNCSCKNCRVYLPIDYRIAEDTILQPDVSIVCGDITKIYLDFTPALVVEILSPSTILRDRHTKFKLYEQQGVLFYVMINTDNETIEIYQLRDGRYELVSMDQKDPFSFQLEGDCRIEVVLGEIWS